MSPEITIILLNLIIVLVAYLSIYPKIAGSDLNKISFYDVLVSCFALLVVGMSYWGTGHQFSLLFMDTKWFWFTLATYTAIEVPMVLWYISKVKSN